MPRIVETWFDERYAIKRDALIATSRRRLSAERPEVQAVGKWLESEYSEAKVRKVLESLRQEHRRRLVGQPMPPEGGRLPLTGYRDPDLPGDNLRADRLEQAFTALHGRNQGGDLLRLLGRNLTRNARETNALRVVVVSVGIVDPDAGEWLESVTPLASCPWQGDESAVPPVKGRADVAQWWAHEALALLEEACSALGWESATDADARREGAGSAVETDWRDVQRRLLELRDRGDTYTSIGKLADRLGCAKATVKKAIDNSPKLRGWQARHAESKRSPRATSINDVVTDNTEQTREVDPAEEAESTDWEIEFARLIDDASEAERASLHALPEDQKRALAAELRNDPDDYDRILGRTP